MQNRTPQSMNPYLVRVQISSLQGETRSLVVKALGSRSSAQCFNYRDTGCRVFIDTANDALTEGHLGWIALLVECVIRQHSLVIHRLKCCSCLDDVGATDATV